MQKGFGALWLSVWLAWMSPLVMAEAVLSETDMALGYYLPLAEQGESYAQLTIGEIYMEGAGVDENLINAYAWFYVALYQGVQEAQPIMVHVYEQLSEEQRVQAEQLAAEFVKLYVPQR